MWFCFCVYVYSDLIRKWTAKKLKCDVSKLTKITKALYQGDIDKFQSELDQILKLETSFMTSKSGEANYHFLMTGLLHSMGDLCYIYSDIESGTGRADHIIIPKKHQKDIAFVLEYKEYKLGKTLDLETSAKDALKQIDQKEYITILKQHKHIKKVIKIGIAFSGKEVMLKQDVEDIHEADV